MPRLFFVKKCLHLVVKIFEILTRGGDYAFFVFSPQSTVAPIDH